MVRKLIRFGRDRRLLTAIATTLGVTIGLAGSAGPAAVMVRSLRATSP